MCLGEGTHDCRKVRSAQKGDARGTQVKPYGSAGFQMYQEAEEDAVATLRRRSREPVFSAVMLALLHCLFQFSLFGK